MTCACKDCPDRRVTEDYNCHTHCEKYAAFREEVEKMRANERKYNDIANYNRRVSGLILKSKKLKQKETKIWN